MLFVPALISGLLLAFSLSIPETSWLAALALVPLLYVLIKTPLSLREALLSGWLCGLLAYGIHFRYASVALNPFVFVVLLLYAALYAGLFAAGVALCVRQGKEWGCLIAPFLWTALEFIRAHAFTGLQVGTLGASQVELLPVIQIASITGVFGISFLLAVINTSLVRLLLRPALISRYTTLWLASSGILLASTLIYGFLALRSSENGTDTFRVATIQGAIDERGEAPAVIRRNIFDRYRSLTLSVKDFRPELTVFPETMTGSYLSEDSLFLSFIREMGVETGSMFLIGSRHLINDAQQYGLFNSAFLLDSTGRIRDRYDKVRLVPFGEYTPFGIWVPWLAQFRLSQAELTPGDGFQPIQSAETPPIGIGICYEAMYGGDMRKLVSGGARLLVILSDDFWFYGTTESQQYFNEAVLRAVENRIPVVRCANMGVSGIIDTHGRVINASSDDQPQTTYGAVPLRTDVSVYNRIGDVLAWGCVLVSLLSTSLCLWHRRIGKTT